MPKRICGAKNRQGKPCQRPPLKGKKRCRLHGGATPSGPDSVHFKHGRYAEAFRGQMAVKFSAAKKDEDPLDLLPELNIMRVAVSELVEKTSGQRSPSPKHLVMVATLASDIIKAAAAIVKSRSEEALTRAEIVYIQTRMIQLMEKYVPDPDRRRAYLAEIRGLLPAEAGANEHKELATGE